MHLELNLSPILVCSFVMIINCMVCLANGILPSYFHTLFNPRYNLINVRLDLIAFADICHQSENIYANVRLF